MTLSRGSIQTPHIPVASLSIPLHYGHVGINLDKFQKHHNEQRSALDPTILNSNQLLYVHGIPKPGGGLMPQYVGRGRVHNDGKKPIHRVKESIDERIHQIINNNNNKRPSRLIVNILNVNHFSRQKNYTLLKSSETLLIQNARKVNRNLLNRAQTSEKQMINSHIPLSIIGVRNGLFKFTDNRLGTQKQKEDGMEFARMLGWN